MNTDGGLKFGLWNAGSRPDDYAQLIRDRNDLSSEGVKFGDLERSNKDDADMLDSIDKLRDKLLSETATELSYAADVFALQEVSGDTRPDIQAFKKQGFEIIRSLRSKPGYPSETDTAIAINPTKFKAGSIEDRSFNASVSETDFAIAVATEKATGKKIAFVSGHISGFNLEEKNLDSLKENAKSGDDDIKCLIQELDKRCSDCDIVLIGADMNAIPHIYADRFKLFENAGFELCRTGKPTSLMSRGFRGQVPQLQERELDYIFVKHQTPNRLAAFFNHLFKKERVSITRLMKEKTPLTLDAISSPSDHIPIFLKVEEVVVKNSAIHNFFASIGSLFNRFKLM